MSEHKTFEISDFKALTSKDEVGSFEALVSVFGNVDAGGDRVQKGAFSRSLEEWKTKGRSVPVLWSHDDQTVPIGVVTDATEINAGLRVKAKLLIDDNPQAKAVHAAMKAGALNEFSFGYGAKDFANVVEDGQQVRVLKDLDLFEVSPVFRGMNPDTTLRAVKALPDDAKGELADIQAALVEQARRMTELSEKQADVVVKGLADSLQDVIDGFEPSTEVKEQEDNPDPNPADEVAKVTSREAVRTLGDVISGDIAAGEEGKARIGRLLLEKPIHQEIENVHEDQSPAGEAV